MRKGALQRPSGALGVRCGMLTPPETRRVQPPPPRGRCCVYPYRATHPFQRPCLVTQVAEKRVPLSGAGALRTCRPTNALSKASVKWIRPKALIQKQIVLAVNCERAVA